MSLTSLQQYRTQVEDQLKMELAQVAQALMQAEQSCERLAQEQGVQEERYRQEMREGMQIEQLLQWQSRFEAHAAASEQARRTVAHWRQQWEDVQVRLVAARQDRQTLERLAERYREAAQTEERRREQHATDDAAHYHGASKGEL
ncbi:MAG: flagellar export protein FliJ [Nitrospira sp.]|jgi:flagellar export protein FliJ|nr:flagellar export protein FliJ [Nitrospira sp.]